MSVLDRIIAYKREEVAARKRALSLSELERQARQAQSTSPVQGFLRAIERAAPAPALIAEIKKASPSKGVIRADFDPAAIALAYAQGGATCLSVLTDAPSFQGSEAYVAQARAAALGLPVLRKDFMIDPWQITESRAIGADAVLIIMAAVDDALAVDLLSEAQVWGLDALFEVHNEDELERALSLTRLIGVNNRSLETFETDLSVTERLAPRVPSDVLLVSESGIRTHDDIARLQAVGARAFLVGESLMRETDVAAATRALLGG